MKGFSDTFIQGACFCVIRNLPPSLLSYSLPAVDRAISLTPSISPCPTMFLPPRRRYDIIIPPLAPPSSFHTLGFLPQSLTSSTCPVILPVCCPSLCHTSPAPLSPIISPPLFLFLLPITFLSSLISLHLFKALAAIVLTG